LPPATPTTPVATVQGGDIAVSVNKGAAIAGTPKSFTVRSAEDATKTCTVTGSSGSCTVTSLASGTSYSFIAVASNDGGSSTASVASNAVKTPATAITVPAAVTPTVKKGRTISFSTINKSAKILVPKNAKVVLTVTAASKRICSVSKTTVRALAVGTCSLSVAVTPQATTKVKKPKTVKTTTKVIVTK
jgi:hypothetical protein